MSQDYTEFTDPAFSQWSRRLRSETGKRNLLDDVGGEDEVDVDEDSSLDEDEISAIIGRSKGMTSVQNLQFDSRDKKKTEDTVITHLNEKTKSLKKEDVDDAAKY